MRRVKGNKNSGSSPASGKAKFARRKTTARMNDYKIQCDITGQVCMRSEAKLTWDGLLVSKQNWDVKHPQLVIRTHTENISVANARPFQSREGGGLSVAEFQADPDGSFLDNFVDPDAPFSDGFIQLSDQTISVDASAAPNPPTGPLAAASGTTPATVTGLFADTTIFAFNRNIPTTMAVGSTRTSAQQADYAGTEPLFTDATNIQGATPRSTTYTQSTISLGQKRYVEYRLLTAAVFSTFPTFGFQADSNENPGVDSGFGDSSFSFTTGGQKIGVTEREIGGLTERDGPSGFTFGINDVISISYTVNSEVISMYVHKNGAYIGEYIAARSTLAGLAIRPAITIAAPLGTAAYDGTQVEILTHQGVQVYAPPDTFEALET